MPQLQRLIFHLTSTANNTNTTKASPITTLSAKSVHRQVRRFKQPLLHRSCDRRGGWGGPPILHTHFLDVPPSTSSEPSWNQSHRNLVSKPLEGNGSGSAIHVRGQTDLLRANTPTSGYTSTPPDAASEPSSRFIVHTDAGMIMNSRQSREQIEQDVVELPPRYDTVA